MQSFMTFGEICERTEAETLQLAMAEPNLESEEPLKMYNALMDRLDNLQEQASELESSILSLTESNITTSTPPALIDSKTPLKSALQVQTIRRRDWKTRILLENRLWVSLWHVFQSYMPKRRTEPWLKNWLIVHKKTLAWHYAWRAWGSIRGP